MNVRSLLPSFRDMNKSDYDPFRSLQREIDQVFNDFSRALRPIVTTENGSDGLLRLAPRVDISETETAMEVTAELPGVEDGDINVTLTNDVLSIKGEKKVEKEDKTKDYHLVERSYGLFQRAIPVPFDVDPGKVEAKFEKGILKVTLPKPPEVAAKSHKVAIESVA